MGNQGRGPASPTEGGTAARSDPDGDLTALAGSFGAVASDYHEHRPDYPLAAITWALAPVSGPGRRPRVLDLGAGTGKLTTQLAGLASGWQGRDGNRASGVPGQDDGPAPGGPAEVLAVEPDPRMLAQLRAKLPSVTALSGSAEVIPLPDSCVDAVLSGQAAHWFSLDRAMPEIARVLVPGGVLAGLWNTDDDRVGWVAGLHRVIPSPIGRSTRLEAADGPDAISNWLGRDGRGDFGPPETAGFEHSQARTAESMIATLATHSAFVVMEAAERAAKLDEAREYLAATPETSAGEFSLPIYTHAVRTIRRPVA